MTSRVLGLVRDLVLAHQFGARDAMDAYNVAFRLPGMVRDLFAEGAMSAAFVPTFTQHLGASGQPAAFRLGNNVFNALLVVTGAVALLLMLAAPPLVSMFASDYHAVPGKFELTVLLARIMLPALTFIALAAAVMGMLNSLHHYFVPALAPAMFNVVTIVAALAVMPLSRIGGVAPITIIAIATIVGGLAQLGLQWPLLRREGFRWRPELNWRDEGLARILVLMGPGTLGMAATQVNVFVNTWLATSQGTGAVSYLQYAFRIMYLPIGLFGVSIATAVLPAVSRHSARSDDRAIRTTLADGLSLMMMLNVPATVGLIVLAHPIVQLLLERGRFTPDATIATAAALQWYAVGLVGYSVTRIASPTFYALGRNRTPVAVGIVTIIVNVVLNLALVRLYSFRGLALGTSLAALFNGIVLMALLRHRLAGLDGTRLAGSFVRIVTAAIVMGVAAHWMMQMLESWVRGDALAAQIVRLGGTIGVALLVLAGTAWLLRIREFDDALSLVTGRFRRSR